MSIKHQFHRVIVLGFVAVLAWPTAAQAQHRGPGGRSSHVVIVGSGFGFRGYGLGLYDAQYPWGRYGPWGPYYYPYSYPYYEGYSAAARVEVQPKDAEVYVDGSQAGIVDDFDGFFQSLTLRPGEHEITIYLEGYRTERRTLYFSPGTTQRIKLTLEKLPAGQSSGPRPKPLPPPAPEDRSGQAGTQPRAPQYPPAQAPATERVTRFGTLSIKVAPADAEITVDGQAWKAPGGDLRLSVKLSVGRHHIEVKKDGFETYTEDVLIRPDATMTLNVGLTKR